MRFGLLGPLAVWRDDGTPVRVPGVKVRALLVDLLVHEGRTVSADRLVDDVWDGRPPANASGALQAKVSQLRAVLDEMEPAGRERLAAAPPGYALRTDPDDVDVGRFDRLVGRARAAEPRAAAALFTEALGMWRGDAFAEFADAAFLRAVRDALEERRLVVHEELAETRLQLGEHALLAGELGDLVERHPLRERLRAAHLRALYGAGRPGDALAGYDDVRRRLADELGLDPGPELVRLQREILDQDPGLDRPYAPVAPAGPARSNVPRPLTALVGRSGTVDDLTAALDANRLVTLTGPGGVGKTRLAVEVAGRAAGGEGRVVLVELASVRPGTTRPEDRVVDDIVDAVAEATGLRDDGGTGHGRAGGPARWLAAALGEASVLLVLDNCEHVVGPAAAVVRELLGGAARLRVLATSREPLGIAGERVVVVDPLESPTHEAPDPETYGAVRLFVERATAADPGFVLGPDTVDDVVALCRRLDGLPLALELAATRVRGLGVHELTARLDDRFRLLTPARGAGSPLWAVIDWSWQLLDEPERALLRRMAVHAEGCVLDAARAVCAGDGVGPEEVAELLARLVDRSLVAVDDTRGPRRYRLLESVAAYCAHQLEQAGEAAAVRERHGRHYTALVERAALRGPDQRRWLDRLDAEWANLARALDHALEAGDTGLALRLVDASSWYWFLRGRLRHAARALDRVLEQVPGTAPGDPRAALAGAWRAGMLALVRDDDGRDPSALCREALADTVAWANPADRAAAEWFLGLCLDGAGDLATAEELVERGLAGFRAVGDRWGIAAALATRASHLLLRGDLASSAREARRSLELFTEHGDRWGRSRASATLASLAEIAGDYDEAARLHRDTLRQVEELGLWQQVWDRWARLGRVALLTGDHDAAHDYHEGARRLAAEHGAAATEAFSLAGLAIGARRTGDLDAAEGYLRTALEWNLRVGYQPGIAQSWNELGYVVEQRGDAEAALALHTDGLAVATTTGDRRAVAFATEGIAGAHAAAGRAELAARLLGSASALRSSLGAPLPVAERGDVDRIEAAAREALGDASFRTAFEQGAAESIEDPTAAG